MRSIIITAAAIILATTAHAKTPKAGSTLTGVAHVKDGDGVKLGPWDDIRLQGIAAPEDNEEKRDPGGPESTANLKTFVEGKNVRCDLDGTQTRGRPVGVCFLVDAVDPYTGRFMDMDIGLHQVQTGHARDCPRFSKGRYAQAEAQARASGKDLSAIYPLPDICVRP